jgi:CPA2 family monovalent cation:H+ antiporter-2
MNYFLAAGAAPPFLTETVAIIAAGAGVAYVCQRLRLVPIVGFLLAGVLIGPNALGLVRDRALVDAAAEVGVILLLFTIGIEFSLERLARIKRLIFAGGGLQVGLATLLTTGVLAAFGVDWRAGLFTGFLLALSSTAIVLKLLGDRGETNAEHGRVGIGLLVFQDLAIIVMVLLVPMLSSAGGAEAGASGSGLGIVWALAKAGAIIAAVLIFARRLMPPVLEAVARTCAPEIFLLSVIAVCFGTAYLTSLAGVSLSLGAFLGGLVVSESRFSEHAFSEILPLQILFSATFFISVGMLLDVSFLFGNFLLVMAAIAFVLAVKVLTTGAGVLALGFRLPTAAAAALMLAQVGEFSFVLERVGRDAGLSPAGLGEAGSQTFIAATVVLMVLTPLLMWLGSGLASVVEAKGVERIAARAETEEPPAHLPELEDHVIVAGYGQAARRLVRVMNGSRIPYVITTLSPGGANEAEAEGLPVLRGDATRQRTLQLAGVERAKMLVVADDEPAIAKRIAAVARTLNPTMRILVRTRYIGDVENLKEAGADRVVAEELESIVGLFGEVLRDYQVAAEEIDEHEEALRRSGYAVLLRAKVAEGPPAVVCRLDPKCFDTRTVTVREGAPILRMTLADMAAESGVEVRGLRRDGRIVGVDGGEVALRPGDELTLYGSGEAFARGARLFRPDGEATKGSYKLDADERGEEASGEFDGGEVGAGEAGASEDDGAGRDETKAYDTERVVSLDVSKVTVACSHLSAARGVLPSARGCEDCLRTGDRWVHLRVCLTCGHVGCCDSSPNRHATKHFHSTEHPIVKSFEPDEDWAWCYPDRTLL